MDQNTPPPSDPPSGWQGEQQSSQGQQPGQYTNPPWQNTPGGQPQYGYGGGQQIDHPKGMTAFIMSLLGLLICGILGIVGLSMGRNAQRDVDAHPGMYANAGLIKAAVVMGWISIAFLIFQAIAIFVFVGAMVAAGAGAGAS